MFNILCANCGRPEISHGKGVRDLFHEWWDVPFYHEEPDVWYRDGCSKREHVKGYLKYGLRGYRYSLKTCPGFRYPKSKIAYLMERYCEWIFERHGKEAPENEELLNYIRELGIDFLSVETLAKKADRILSLFEKERKAKAHRSGMMPISVHIFADSCGRSTVVIGE